MRSSYFSEDPSVPPLTRLILRDGTRYLARDYSLEAGKLVCVTLDWDRRLLPVARLDLDETVRLNRERNVEVCDSFARSLASREALSGEVSWRI